MIHIKPVDESSVEVCAYLKCTEEQRDYTNSPIWSLLQTAYTPLNEHCKMYAIFNDSEVVGMVRLDFTLFEDFYMFTNLLIDKDYQRKHYASEAIKCILDVFKNDGRHTLVKIHVDPQNAGAIALYKKAGFQYAGEVFDGVFSEYEICI